MRRIDTERFVRATRSTSRDINRRILLNLVRENEPVSRADLARRMGIGRGMITSLVTELIEAGEVYSGSTVAAPRGRRPEMLYVRTRDRFVVAVDVRLSRTYLTLSDFGGRAGTIESFDTIIDPAALAIELASRIRRLLDEHGARGRCAGIGLVVPGMVDRPTGLVLRAPQLDWTDVDIRNSLAAATGLEVKIENAPIACALAQIWLGDREARAPQNFVYVTVSDGVGAAIVVDGQVIRGASDTAGEFGHMPLNMDGPECMCGSRGCLEAYTSNLATVARFLGKEFSRSIARDLAGPGSMTITDVISLWKQGDLRARDALLETAHYLAAGLASIVSAINPELIFVGGEITEAWALFSQPVAHAISRRALTERASRTLVVPEAPGSHPRLTGATALVAAPAFAAPIVA